MQSTNEIDANISLMEKGYIPEDLKTKINSKKRKLIVAEYCIACGNCVERCRQGGINIVKGKPSQRKLYTMRILCQNMS